MPSQPENLTPADPTDGIPTAAIRDGQQVASGRMVTRLWWLTGICAIFATGLVISSLQSQGTSIAIQFDEGHGLKAGDTLRYRGIDIGVVQSVKISDDLESVEAEVLLSPGNERVAVDGSQFWIERPRLRLGQIGGLDTVLGAKYIGVLPGDKDAARATQFTGLENPLLITQGDSLEIRVTFPRGEGLGVGDAVRYRGITVGEVTYVDLAMETDAVQVGLRLVGSSRKLARAGTQFWIERPRLDLTEIRGLETVLGGLYIALQPTAEDSEPQTDFVGLPNPPPLPLRDGSLEIELDASNRMGISSGAPILYRGLEVGRVSNVGLADDGATVKVRAVIDAEYAELVRDNSKWWSSGGVQIDAKLSGVEISMDSVYAWLRGGIAFGTPNSPGKNVVTGHRFVLEPEPLPEWLDWQPRIAVNKLGSIELPNTIRAVVSWNASIIGLYRRRTVESWAIALDDGYLRVPTSFIEETDEIEREVKLEVAGKSSILQPGMILRDRLTTKVKLPEGAEVPKWPRERSGNWTPESVLMIVNPDLPEPLALDGTRVSRVATGLTIAPGVPISDSLSGSPVIDASSGDLIGQLISDSGKWIVAYLDE